MKAAGLLDLSLPVGFELPDPGRGADVDEDSLTNENDAPEFAQDFVGEER
jgi:segregation and condensation protein B